MKPLNWQPHTVLPAKPVNAILAGEIQEDTGEYFILGNLYIFNGQHWVEEASGQPLDTDMPFFWLDEADLMATITPVKH